MYVKFIRLIIGSFIIFNGAGQAVLEEDIPPQNNQIKTYIKYAKADSPFGQEYKELKDLSRTNFNLIGETIKERFGEDAQQYKFFQQTSSVALKDFEENQMTLKALIKIYYRFATLLDRNPNTIPFYLKESLKKIDRVSEFVTPIPIVSLTGLARIGKLSDLISQGFCYIGIPLIEYPRFDGEMRGAQRYFDHELFHATFLGEPTYRDETLEFLQKFNKCLFKTVQRREDRKIINLIRFFSTHEKGQGIFQLLVFGPREGVDANVRFQTFAEEILKNALINTKGLRFFDIYKDFADYAEQKNLMTFSKEADEQTKTGEFARMINDKVETFMNSKDALFSFQ